MKKITYTIFGHTGFIGSNFKKKLKNHNLILPKRKQFLFKENLGHIIYCIGSDNWKKDPYNSFFANIGYIPQIINNNNFSSFNYLSSIKIYNHTKATKESLELNVNPSNNEDYFLIKKICAESFLNSQNKKFKIFRLTNTYGDNFYAPLALSAFIRNSVKNKVINLTINKNSLKDFLNINDAINLMIKIIKSGKKNTYNIASGKRISLNTIAKKIQHITNCKIIYKNQNVRIDEPKINIDQIKKEFKFKETSYILDDLKHLIHTFKKRINYE